MHLQEINNGTRIGHEKRDHMKPLVYKRSFRVKDACLVLLHNQYTMGKKMVLKDGVNSARPHKTRILIKFDFIN